jgi:hypothetical protein
LSYRTPLVLTNWTIPQLLWTTHIHDNCWDFLPLGDYSFKLVSNVHFFKVCVKSLLIVLFINDCDVVIFFGFNKNNLDFNMFPMDWWNFLTTSTIIVDSKLWLTILSFFNFHFCCTSCLIIGVCMWVILKPKSKYESSNYDLWFLHKSYCDI